MSNQNQFSGQMLIDHQVVTHIVDRHHGQVFGLCLKMLGHRQDAEDATQETFSRFFKYFDRWDRSRPIEPWLIKIAGNRCRSVLSRRRPVSELSESQVPIDQQETRNQAADHLREEIRLVLRSLPDPQRLAFELFHDQQLSYEQIAIELDCPIGTAKIWVHRARKRLIDQLQSRGVVQQPRPRSLSLAKKQLGLEPGANQ